MNFTVSLSQIKDSVAFDAIVMFFAHFQLTHTNIATSDKPTQPGCLPFVAHRTNIADKNIGIAIILFINCTFSILVEGKDNQNRRPAIPMPSIDTICQVAQIIRICRSLSGAPMCVGTTGPLLKWENISFSPKNEWTNATNIVKQPANNRNTFIN